MRLYEFTNAQEQLALLRVIVDNTWQAIEHEAQQQARAAAQKAASKPKDGRSATGKMPSVKPAAAAVNKTVRSTAPVSSVTVIVFPDRIASLAVAVILICEYWA